jgi:hypothetical protein
MKEEVTVHGSIIFLLKKFINHICSPGTWDQLLAEMGIENNYFELTKAYPLKTLEAIMNRISEKTGLPVEELKEKFGEHMVPDLFHMYRYYLRPEWKTYEILLNTEEVMHGAVRKLNSTAHPPVINVSKVSKELLMIDYFSKRKMSSLAMGIIRGIAKYYGEQDKVTVEIMTNPNAEKVQIKVHFSIK